MMHNNRLSAAYRIAFIYSAVMSVLIAALGAIVFFAADAKFRAHQDSSISAECDELVHEYRNGGTAELKRNIARREADKVSDAFGYAAFDPDGHRFAGSLNTPRPDSGWQEILYLDFDGNHVAARAFATRLDKGKILVVALSSRPVEEVGRTIMLLFVLGLVALIVIGLLGAMILGGYLRERLERISNTAQAILTGDLSRRIDVNFNGDEFDRLGNSLNIMLDRISGLMANLRQVSSDLAHDLRSPLTRLRTEIETGLEFANDAASQLTALKKAKEQCDRVLSLFTAILRVAEVEGGSFVESFADVNVSEFVEDICESFVPPVHDSGRVLTWAITLNLNVKGDFELLTQALINLLENATLHTAIGTTIEVSVRATASEVIIGVADNGVGVKEDQRREIVKRFVRLDLSRGTPGHGLGLSLVAAITTAHNGRLALTDNDPGLRAEIILPR